MSGEKGVKGTSRMLTSKEAITRGDPGLEQGDGSGSARNFSAQCDVWKEEDIKEDLVTWCRNDWKDRVAIIREGQRCGWSSFWRQDQKTRSSSLDALTLRHP